MKPDGGLRAAAGNLDRLCYVIAESFVKTLNARQARLKLLDLLV
jgi:hypothetical protein